MARFTLSKEERLSSLKEIAFLFESGHSITSFPIRLVWRQVESDIPFSHSLKSMFSVSKKKFPRAVDRNRIKRLMRENYRMLKPVLYEKLGHEIQYHLAFIFTGNELPDYLLIQKGMTGALDRWLKNILSHQS